MNYFISVGEASGDIHASCLIESLRSLDNKAEFSFLGGDLMSEASGHQPIIHYRDMAFMGFSEVIRHLPTVFGNLKKAKKAIATTRPDALILVDYPSFNLKLAEFAHALGIPTYYYISPKVWAWKEHRVKSIKKFVRRVYCILPFEPEFYRSRHDYNATYVGNPSKEEIDKRLSTISSRDEFLKRHNLPDKPILALIPGSRRGEIKNNLMVMEQAARLYSEFQTVVAAAPGIDLSYYGYFLTPGIPIISDDTFSLMRHAQAALVTSGTATLECALIGTPQIVCYRSNGMKLTYDIMSKILKIPFVSLPNLIVGKEIVPELLLHKCNIDEIARHLNNILPGRPGYDNQIDGYRQMRSMLGDSPAAPTTAKAIIDDLRSLH
ncbi:MAG: lipid-A-disaccharide synthase [Muribaculum sp.]|nr:lipid-A-disaccharide synthase [Muribaculum sp.]